MPGSIEPYVFGYSQVPVPKYIPYIRFTHNWVIIEFAYPVPQGWQWVAGTPQAEPRPWGRGPGRRERRSASWFPGYRGLCTSWIEWTADLRNADTIIGGPFRFLTKFDLTKFHENSELWIPIRTVDGAWTNFSLYKSIRHLLRMHLLRLEQLFCSRADTFSVCFGSIFWYRYPFGSGSNYRLNIFFVIGHKNFIKAV